MSQNEIQFFVNLMIFFSKKKSDQIFPFHIYFSHLCKTSNPKKKKKKKKKKTRHDMCI